MKKIQLSKNKIPIFIDLDSTLFNTTEVKKQMFALLETLGFPMEQILATYSQSYKDKGFTIKDFLSRLNSIKKIDILVTEQKILAIHEKVGLYNDSLGFLKNIDRSKYEVNLLTFGSPTHQKYKVKISSIEKYFDNLFYTQEYKVQYLAKLIDSKTNFVFIDDLPEVLLDIVKSFPNAEVYCIIRERNKNILMDRNIKIIKNLSNILKD